MKLLMIFLISLPLLTFAQLEEEPNDNIDLASDVSCSNFIEGYIQELEDVDWYRIEIISTGVLEAQLYSVPSNLDLDLGIYQIVNNETKRISSDGDTNASGGQNLTSTAYLNSGTYYIRIVDESNNGYNSDEAYTLNIVCEENLLEMNQTYEFAKEISLDTCFEDNIWGQNECFFDSNLGSNDRDWFTVEIFETGKLNVNVTSVPSDIDIDLGIYQIVNNQPKRISSDGDTNASGGQSLTTTAFLDIGTYYILVNDESNNKTNQETYNLCSAFYPDEFEINQTYELAATIPIDTCFEENIWGENECYFNSNNGANDQDWFRVDVTEPGILFAEVFSVPSNIDLNLSINKLVNIQVVRISDDGDTNAGGGQNLSTAAIVEEGEYFIHVNDESNNSTNQETYSFCIEFTPNAYEINQTFELAASIPIDTCFEETIWGENECFFDSNFGSNDRDWFEVEVLESGTINTEVSSVPAFLDLNLGIYEFSNNQLKRISDDDAFDAGGGQSVSSTAYVNAGNYFIHINDENNNFIINENFTFCVEFFPNKFEINQTIELAAKIPQDTCFKEDVWGQNENFIETIPLTSYDKDWFEIEINEQCKFKASATNVPLLIQPDLKLYRIINGMKEMVAEDNVFDAASGQSVFLETDLNAGLYYLLSSDEISLATLNDSETFDLCVSCDEISNTNEFVDEGHIKIYPSPAKDVIFIETLNWSEYSQVSIVDMQGRILFNKAITGKLTAIDLLSASGGLYFIHLISNDGILIKKFVKSIE